MEEFNDQDPRSEFGEILMHTDEAQAIFRTELRRRLTERGITTEALQPAQVPQLVEANMETMLTVLAENNHRIVDLLYQMGLITFSNDEGDE
jgi:hypothetical protein